MVGAVEELPGRQRSHCKTIIKGSGLGVKGPGISAKGPCRGSGGSCMVSCIGTLKGRVMPLSGWA